MYIEAPVTMFSSIAIFSTISDDVIFLGPTHSGLYISKWEIRCVGSEKKRTHHSGIPTKI